MKSVFTLSCLAIASLWVTTANAQTAQVPPGAAEFPGGWCRVYTANTPAQFQNLLAQHVSAGHWIVSATPIRGHDGQMEYVVAVCSRRPTE